MGQSPFLAIFDFLFFFKRTYEVAWHSQQGQKVTALSQGTHFDTTFKPGNRAVLSGDEINKSGAEPVRTE